MQLILHAWKLHIKCIIEYLIYSFKLFKSKMENPWQSTDGLDKMHNLKPKYSLQTSSLSTRYSNTSLLNTSIKI